MAKRSSERKQTVVKATQRGRCREHKEGNRELQQVRENSDGKERPTHRNKRAAIQRKRRRRQERKRKQRILGERETETESESETESETEAGRGRERQRKTNVKEKAIDRAQQEGHGSQ